MKGPKFEVGEHIRISKYNNVFAKVKNTFLNICNKSKLWERSYKKFF